MLFLTSTKSFLRFRSIADVWAYLSAYLHEGTYTVRRFYV